MAGRKKLKQEEKLVPFTILVKPEIYSKIKKFSADNNLKLTDMNRDFYFLGFKIRQAQKALEPTLKTAREALEDKLLTDLITKITKSE